MAVALLASGSFLGIFFAALLFSILSVGGLGMPLAFLSNLTGGSRLNIGFIIAIVALVAVWFIMKRTTLGFEIRAVGLNPDAARYAGMSAKRTAVTAMTISLAGALMGALPGWLRAQFGASEVITTIMLNYIALYGGNAFVQGLPKKLMATTDMTNTLHASDSLRWDIGEVLRSMTPLILTAAGFLVAQSAGFFNIGLAGQVWVGWIASTWFVLVNQSMTPWLSIPLAVIIGAHWQKRVRN
ncbi:ABC transporter permease [Weissella confusa]|uniref:ABC transporter permease n=1 Tax=Weissella confusa TaxID=1583 RepID=A0A923NG52_WEICO|nr:ABC transporter permease [Weissella confusa]